MNVQLWSYPSGEAQAAYGSQSFCLAVIEQRIWDSGYTGCSSTADVVDSSAAL